MSSGNAKLAYEPREIDEQLQKAAVGWLRPTSKLRWILLNSKPGKGNSSLLKHFREWMVKYQAGFDDMKTVHIRGEANYYPAPGGPLLLRIAQLHSASQRTRLQRITRRVRHAPPARKVAAGAILLCFLALLSLWAGISEYNKSPEAPWTSPRLWTRGFVFEFLPANWYKLPVWLFTDAFSGIFLAGALSSLVIYLSRGSFFGKLQRERVKKKDLRVLKSDKRLVEALLEITRNCRGLILIVDDAQWLPDDEKQLLADLVEPPPQRPELAALTAKRRILIVTLETFEVRWPQRPDAAVQTFDVPDFTLDALGRIAWTQLRGDGFERMKEAERESMLRKAQGDINALFAGRVEAFDKEVGRLFEAASAEGFPDTFDRKDLMAYWAVSRAASVTKTEMKEWLAALGASGHLREFGLGELENLQLLINDFPKTTLARREGQTYFFDIARCQALPRWLRKSQSDEPRRLLARAHYFWFRHFSSKFAAPGARPAAELSADDRQEIKEATWHAIQINKYLDKASDILTDAVGLDAAGREERSYAAAAVLLTASAVYCGEGNTTESNDLVIDALEWLPDGDGERRRQWLEHAAGQLWHNFWLTGSAAAVKHLEDLAARSPGLADGALWQACRRHEQLLRCEMPLPPAPDEALLPDEVRNLQRLTETLYDIRQGYGLIYPALDDPDFKLREPLPVPGVNFHEAQLRALQAAAMLGREDEAGRAQALEVWRARLRETEPVDGALGDDALHCYEKARYWHTLADACRVGVARIKRDENIPPADEGEARAELFESVRPFCLTPPPESAPLPDYLWQEGLAAYERSRQLATFLNYQPLAMEVSFREGELLQTHTPAARRKAAGGGEPWWGRWDWLFWQALNLEREFNWIIYTPIMHRIRWAFFSEREDNERSVEDAYNALQAIKRAQYPRRLILEWHKQVSAQLTNHSDSAEDRRRDAELNEEWANELAALPEAREHWNFETLNLEQANALSFAAQAHRFMDELDAAEKLLDRAEALVAASGVGENGAGAESQKLRTLKISVKIQRAWIRKAQKRDEDYERAIWETWAGIRRDDRECAIVLAGMLEIEHLKKLLGDPWPPPGAEAHEDGDNPALSLPARWFSGPSALRLKNRFEFRLYQLLSLTNYFERLERLGFAEESLQSQSGLNFLHLAMSGARLGIDAARPELLFRVEVLKAVARADWLNLNRFAEIALAFAGYGRAYSHTAETQTYILNLLEAVRFYFSEVEKVDSEELEALRLLMDYEPDSPNNYRLEYVRVLCQHKHLLEHERLARDAVSTRDWYDAAKRAHKYLFMLVDKGLREEKLRIESQRLGVAESSVLNQEAALRAAYQSALEKYEGGDAAGCLATLTPVLPRESSPWVFMDDLEALNLWLKCAPHGGGGQVEVQRREAQLRSFARQYIRQLGVVIREEEVQQLVAGIVGGLHDSL